jgi:hypothetical protein
VFSGVWSELFSLSVIGEMGYVGYFYVESKSYELRLGDGSRNIKLTEWGRMNLSTVFMGEVRLVWLLKMMNELVLETTGIGACRDHRMGGSVMFLQKRKNKYGKFMELTEYGRGGRRSFVVIPEGREGQGWKHCIVQLVRLVNYMNQTRDKEVKKAPIQPREVVPGRTFAAVVEGKNSDTGTESREEGNMGNPTAEINLGNVEKSEKGKEKMPESENHADVLKWEDFLAMLSEGIINMKIMRGVVEDIRCKLEILERTKGLGCEEKAVDQKDPQQEMDGVKIQLGQEANGPRSTKLSLCCSKTYYRKRYRAVALRKAARMSRHELRRRELSPEGSKSSPEVRRCDETEFISDGDTNHDRENKDKAAPARKEGMAMDEKRATGGGSSREAEQVAGKSHEAGRVMGQVQCSTHARRNSPEPIQVLETPQIIPEMMEGDDLVGQNPTASVGREDSCMIITPKLTKLVAEAADADKEKLKCSLEQKVMTNPSGGVGSLDGGESDIRGVENEEVLGVGNSEGGGEGLEDIIPETVSLVVERCLEFYPKVGITCEGDENKMKMLVEDIANGRQQPIVEKGGTSNSNRGFDRYVNYDRGMSEVQQGKGRGRGRYGVL